MSPQKAYYAIVDLGGGKQWLTSRLFIFALILGEVSLLKALVLLETTRVTRRRFLGISTPRNIRAALAKRYPWLDQAFALAYAEQYKPVPTDMDGQPVMGTFPYLLDAGEVLRISVLVRYINTIQRGTPPTEIDAGTYLKFQTTVPPAPVKTLWERAAWIDAETLERDLFGRLNFSWYEDSPDRSEAEKIEGIWRRRDRFIALVDEDRRFTGLVDRYVVLAKNGADSDEDAEPRSWVA